MYIRDLICTNNEIDSMVVYDSWNSLMYWMGYNFDNSFRRQ